MAPIGCSVFEQLQNRHPRLVLVVLGAADAEGVIVALSADAQVLEQHSYRVLAGAEGVASEDHADGRGRFATESRGLPPELPVGYHDAVDFDLQTRVRARGPLREAAVVLVCVDHDEKP